MAKTKMRALSLIPIRTQMDTNPENVSGNVRKDEEVMVTSTREKDDIVYGRIGKGLYVIVERNGVSNFEQV